MHLFYKRRDTCGPAKDGLASFIQLGRLPFLLLQHISTDKISFPNLANSHLRKVLQISNIVSITITSLHCALESPQGSQSQLNIDALTHNSSIGKCRNIYLSLLGMSNSQKCFALATRRPAAEPHLDLAAKHLDDVTMSLHLEHCYRALSFTCSAWHCQK